MQQPNEQDAFFYEYFPQFNYPERAIPCGHVQDYPVRDLNTDKSKLHCLTQPIPHPPPLLPPPAHTSNVGTSTSQSIAPNLAHTLHQQEMQCATATLPPDTFIPSTTSIHYSQQSVAPPPIEVPPTSIQNTTARTQEMLVTFNHEVAKANKAANKKKRTRLRHLINPEEWVRNKNKKARMLGQAYKGWIKTDDGKYILGAERKALTCGAPCDCKRSQREKELKCRQLGEKERKAIFEKTCAMSWEAKKVWVQSHVEALQPRRQTHAKRHRTMSIAYYLPTCSGRRKRVCRNMFLSTLGRNRRQIESWIKEGRLSLPHHTDSSDDSESAQVTEPTQKNASRQRSFLAKRVKAREFLDSLHKTTAHNSSFAVVASFKTGTALYNYYKKAVGEVQSVSTFVFFQEMKTKRIKLLRQKKNTKASPTEDSTPMTA